MESTKGTNCGKATKTEMRKHIETHPSISIGLGTSAYLHRPKTIKKIKNVKSKEINKDQQNATTVADSTPPHVSDKGERTDTRKWKVLLHRKFSPVNVFLEIIFSKLYQELLSFFTPESGMMWTFDKKNLGKRPLPFPHTPQKNLGRRVCVDRVEYIFCGVIREFFFLNLRIWPGRVRSQFQEGKIV